MKNKTKNERPPSVRQNAGRMRLAPACLGIVCLLGREPATNRTRSVIQLVAYVTRREREQRRRCRGFGISRAVTSFAHLPSVTGAVTRPAAGVLNNAEYPRYTDTFTTQYNDASRALLAD